MMAAYWKHLFKSSVVTSLTFEHVRVCCRWRRNLWHNEPEHTFQENSNRESWPNLRVNIRPCRRLNRVEGSNGLTIHQCPRHRVWTKLVKCHEFFSQERRNFVFHSSSRRRPGCYLLKKTRVSWIMMKIICYDLFTDIGRPTSSYFSSLEHAIQNENIFCFLITKWLST